MTEEEVQALIAAFFSALRLIFLQIFFSRGGNRGEVSGHALDRGGDAGAAFFCI
jgi:hypothetical protein